MDEAKIIDEFVLESEDEHPKQLIGISPSERLGSMFESGLYSDCAFVVEGVEIRAHKVILAVASRKMEQIFAGDVETYTVPYSARVMRLVLQHVYLQDMDIENIDEAQDVIEAAYFFQMSDLVELCCAGIEPEALGELWAALELACRYDSRALREACLALALCHSADLLHEPGLLQASPAALACLLARDVLHVRGELPVLEAVVAWARAGTHSAAERAPVLRQLRVLALSEPDFAAFMEGAGRELFSEDELAQLELEYFGAAQPAALVSPVRTPRLLERHVPICGTDYLAVHAGNERFTVGVRVFEAPGEALPLLRMVVLPSQINPANILYDNVSHRTHYRECVVLEVTVGERVVARGAFCGRVKHGDDVHVALTTLHEAALYTALQPQDDPGPRYYDATVSLLFKSHGYYPLAVETKQDEHAPIVLHEPCRFIHEFILTLPIT